MIVIKQVILDEQNINHIARHGVSGQEVEEVCFSRFAVRGSYAGRFLVIGKTRKARILAIIVAVKFQDVYYLVTARDASKKEKRIYIEKVEGGEK